MTENKKKFTVFKSAHLADWEVAAREELKGESPEKLTQQGNGWSIRPYYDQNAAVPTAPLLTASKNSFLGPRTWFNCPSIAVEDPKESNKLALKYLSNGADGIFFEFNQDVNLEILLKDIEWSYCSLNFLAKKNPDAVAASLKKYITNHYSDKGQIQGAFFGNLATQPIPNSTFRLGGYLVQPSSPVEEITSAFAWFAKAGQHNHQVALSITLGTDFFLELAKLRAYRLTWSRFLDATKSPNAAPLYIHARSLPWIDTPFEPHGNMLKGTTVAMAAILGGCDALTIDPADGDDSTMVRAAGNISNLLREESHFSKVADPVAGSYFLEDLSQQMAASAWKIILPLLPS